MLLSVFVMASPVLDSSKEITSASGEKKVGSNSEPSGKSSSYTASILLGSDNPEHGGEAMGHTYKYTSSSYYYCYSYYYSYIYRSSYSNRRGWAVFDLKDLTQWSGVNVKNVSLVYHNSYTSYTKEMGFTALKTTPYHNPSTSVRKAVYTESGPSGTQIGSQVYFKYSDSVKKRVEVPLNSQAATELNNRLNGSSTYYTFGVGMYVKTLWSQRSSGYAYWYDVRLMVTFEYDSEFESTQEDWGVAFGDDLSGYAYEYTSKTSKNYYNYPSGYQRIYKYSSSSGYHYDYRGYAQWDIPPIRDLLFSGNTSDINITKVSLRFNNHMGNLRDLCIFQMQYDVKTATKKQIFTDCGDGTKYFGPYGSYGYNRREYEWDLGPDAVSDLQDVLTDNNSTFFGLGFAYLIKGSSVYDYGPKLVLEWGDTNQPPVADAGINQTINEGDTVLLDGSGSYSPSGSIVKYEWDFESDGTFDYQETASGALDGSFDGKTEHTYGDNGIYQVTLRVTNNNGLNASDSCVITVNNVAPTVYLTMPSSIDEGQAILFYANATDPGSDDLTFSWDFELGPKVNTIYYNDAMASDPYPSPNGIYPFATLDSVNHIYGDNYNYNLSLEVTDDDGGMTIYTTTINVYNLAPSLSQIIIPPNIEEGASAPYFAEASDPGSDDLTFTWNWGDGTSNLVSIKYNDGIGPDLHPSPLGTYPFLANDTSLHTYGDNGVYFLTLSILDDDGAITTYSTNISVYNVAPEIDSVSILGGDEGVSVEYQASASDPGSDDLTFTWNWGDGSSDTVITIYNDGLGPDPLPSPGGTYPFLVTHKPYHTYGDNGVFTITITVADDDGGAYVYMTNVTISNVAPKIDNVTTPGGDEGTLLSYLSAASDQGSDDLKFTWKWGDGTSDSVSIYYNDGMRPDPLPSPLGTYPFTASDSLGHTYGDNGVYKITLTVEDDDGGSASTSRNVTIVNVAPEIESFTASDGDEGTLLSYLSEAKDQGSDDLIFTWEWGDGTSDTITTHYNDGIGPDPYPSPIGIYPFTASDSLNHTYGDNGVYTIILTVEDDDGGSASQSANVTIDNVAPTITPFGPLSFDEGTNFDLSAVSTDMGSDDLTFTWDLEMGPTVTKVYYNDGTGVDPYPSPWGKFPFSATDLVSHMYGDDGVYTVDLIVEDDDGGKATYSTTISIGNTAPEIQSVEAYVLIDYTLRAAGEKWHNVQMFITADGVDVAFAEVVRYPGDPDDQSVTLVDVKCEVTKVIEVTVLYTPLDDPVNGQLNGATPCWLNLSFEDGTVTLLKHNFNVNQPKNWDWTFGVNGLLVDQKITFESLADDQGSDDLTFSWDWSDGSPYTDTLYCNDGINPEPVFNSGINAIRTPWGPCPFSAVDVKTHTFNKGGNYPVTLTVTDDDGGVVGVVVNIILS
jgi:PKD repeat protein